MHQTDEKTLDENVFENIHNETISGQVFIY